MDTSENREKKIILTITENDSLPEKLDLSEILEEFCQKTCRMETWTVMDAYMKTLPEEVSLAILDIGLLMPLHLELIDKLLSEGLKGIIVHYTDERTSSSDSLDGRPGIVRLKKPVSLRDFIGVINNALEGAESA